MPDTPDAAGGRPPLRPVEPDYVATLERAQNPARLPVPDAIGSRGEGLRRGRTLSAATARMSSDRANLRRVLGAGPADKTGNSVAGQQ